MTATVARPEDDREPSPRSLDLDSEEAVGVIGLGLMGSALTERLLAHECRVVGFDIDPQRREQLLRIGGEIVSSAAAVVEACEQVILCLPDSKVVGQVAREVLPSLRAGQMLIDTTTGEPDDAEHLARLLEERGVVYLDAPVSGNSDQLRLGQVAVFVGGDRDGFQRFQRFPLFSRVAYWVGGSGTGARMKLISNLVLGLNRAALAEGLALADAWEMDLENVLEVLSTSAAYSAVMDVKGSKMITGDDTPQARLAQHHKDVRLILDAGARLGLALPLSEAHDRLLSTAESMGLGDRDNSAIIRAYQRRGGSVVDSNSSLTDV